MFNKASGGTATWFKIGLIGLLLSSLALRFWGLGRFNSLVFDEVYYVKFAHDYLTQTPLFDGHPPLSKYLIAIGIWLGNQWPIGRDTVNSLAGAEYSTWSYRWLNALTGSFMPLVIAGIAYQLTRRPSYSFLAGLFAALDGLFLVESRYALNNVYLVIFGLLGLWFLLLALEGRSTRRSLYFIGSGIFFGASASIKWNGLWFLFGAYGLWLAAWLLCWLQKRFPYHSGLQLFAGASDTAQIDRIPRIPLQRLAQVAPWQIALNLGVVPAVFYRLIWIPHLKFNTTVGFWELQKQILEYHERVPNGPKVHPYCADWYTWILMLRPVAYYYKVEAQGGPLLSTDPAVRPGSMVIYDVHAIGNPFLWWLSTLAIVLVFVVLVQQLLNWRTTPLSTEGVATSDRRLTLSTTEIWLALFIGVNYAANLLPWVKVTRCTFLYHYMGASVFATMAIAWLVDRWLHSKQTNLRMLGIVAIVLIVLAFIFWLPIYLGLPLSTLGFKLRMWLPSWV
ncbi:MAG: phospholipid carrier-dependent glycosyltransferase [Stenomitos rutilans HA7619-LM2]|jgi:dolichyl-phosphate-mannose--protein O-mannosyl transferase|nr:phospholipid carrier-dependent glycosyltransferase [Stenomitos rutilans HA7619-LM2]